MVNLNFYHQPLSPCPPQHNDQGQIFKHNMFDTVALALPN